MSAPKKVVLAYSGGLDTSIILKWLQTEYGCEVVTFTADLGQGEELEPARRKAEMMGATDIYIEDLREEFVRDFVFPMFRANALYEGLYLLGTSIARPLISKRLIEIAEESGADAVAHGATGKGNDQVRFELSAYALNPDIKVIAPWRTPDFEFSGRSDMIEYLERHNIPCSVSKEKPYSTDRNLLHISFEGGILEDPWQEPEESMWLWSVAPEQAPDQPTTVELEFRHGDIVAVDFGGSVTAVASRSAIVKAAALAAQPPKMKMTTDIPASITTPDVVETSIGTFEFFDGVPTKKSAEMAYDFLDKVNAYKALLSTIPTVSINELRRGQASIGAAACHQICIFDTLMDSTGLVPSIRDRMKPAVGSRSSRASSSRPMARTVLPSRPLTSRLPSP